MVDKGRYMETRKKVDGDWLIDRDIYSSALPPVAEGMRATARCDRKLRRHLEQQTG